MDVFGVKGRIALKPLGIGIKVRVYFSSTEKKAERKADQRGQVIPDKIRP